MTEIQPAVDAIRDAMKTEERARRGGIVSSGGEMTEPIQKRIKINKEMK